MIARRILLGGALALASAASGAGGGALWQATRPAAPASAESDPSRITGALQPAAPRLAFDRAGSAQPPIAIFHAFDQWYPDVTRFVCELRSQGYSHVQIAPAQRSNPGSEWWARYQPIDYAEINGRGTEAELAALIQKAHECDVRVIADVVFNHMANVSEFSNLDFPGDISASDFHSRCKVIYDDGNRNKEMTCWLGGEGDLPDLIQENAAVKAAHRAHIDKLLALGIDGFRFDAAKHMEASAVGDYVSYINTQSGNRTWNYLEVITDGDTAAEHYTGVAATTDFVLYKTMKHAFTSGGDLRSLRVPQAVADARSVTFGENHDNIGRINSNAIEPYGAPSDSYLATAYVLARESGTPLVLNWDNADSPFIRFGVQFRRVMAERAPNANVKENVLAVIDSPSLLVMERGEEGWVVLNKDGSGFDVPVLDMTLTHLEGCYRELRNNFTVAIERRADGKKWITRWGTWQRGGLRVEAREALFFVRDPWQRCT